MPSPIFDGLGQTILDTFMEEQNASYLSQESGSQPITVSVIFNARHQEVDVNGIPYGAPRPMAWIRTGVISPKNGDQLTLDPDGTPITYKIREILQDGLELTQLHLAGQ